ncbi:PadR family transcriptional regulator [Actinoplanes sp. NBRC 101535]|uniref:PadR family transcriptional regulator n=1 Tax=Actinoplanes sp. NBRC 101535 TaxID=3032196 RepID=UPI0024A1AC26|nr:PadR family transcriptional regulator [Actinoplanes sp. NBRC 101535]GLY02495.1 hypothetical protein Acsp01_28740 [Actinoplanes sp. NBRC 101535]
MSDDATLTTALRRGTIEFCVLALLDRRELYGVELVRQLGETLGMPTSEGTMYPLLSRLRRHGRIATTWREAPAGPPRRYYTLTPDGEAALSRFRAEWVVFRAGVDRALGIEVVPATEGGVVGAATGPARGAASAPMGAMEATGVAKGAAPVVVASERRALGVAPVRTVGGDGHAGRGGAAGTGSGKPDGDATNDDKTPDSVRVTSGTTEGAGDDDRD